MTIPSIGLTAPIASLDDLRADIALAGEFAYFQTGSEAPVPASVQRVIIETLERESHGALAGRAAHDAFGAGWAATLEPLARLLGVPAHCLAWTRNTSTSMQLAVGSLGWRAGDRLALTAAEHISTRRLAQRLAEITGLAPTVIPVGPGETYRPDAFLDEVARRLTPDHKLFIVSHVSCIDGRRLPAREAVAIARRRGITTLVDGAQAVGQFPISVAQIDPDFYIGSAHKWLLGPAGVGFLYVAPRQLPSFQPLLMPIEREAAPSAMARVALGTETLSLPAGAAAAIAIVERIGLAAIEARLRSLAERLREGLQGLSGLRLLTPRPWELSSGLTSLAFPGRPASAIHWLIDRLWEDYHVVVKFQPDFEGIRISTAPFNTAEEVDRLLEALRTWVPRLEMAPAGAP